MLAGILLMLAACGSPTPTTPATPPATPPPATPPITPPEAPPAIPPVTTPATPPPTPPTPPPPTTPPPPLAVQGPYDIWIPSREFRPSILTVPVGTKVTWTSMDGEEHTVTSATGLFDASLSLGQSFSYTFTERGTFEYACAPHPEMTAKIIVE